MPDSKPPVVAYLAAKQSKRAEKCWDEWLIIEESETFDNETARLIEEIDRKHAAMKQEESER